MALTLHANKHPDRTSTAVPGPVQWNVMSVYDRHSNALNIALDDSGLSKTTHALRLERLQDGALISSPPLLLPLLRYKSSVAG